MRFQLLLVAALTKASISFFMCILLCCEKRIFKKYGFRESKNRPVVVNYKFLIILPLMDSFLLACLPQTLLGDFILGGCYIAYMPFQILICYI